MEGEISPSDVSTINICLEDVLSDNILAPEIGLKRIRDVLFKHRIFLEPILGLDTEGDELVLGITDMESENSLSLYVIYAIEENGYYEFYAELANHDRIEELLSDGGEEEEEM